MMHQCDYCGDSILFGGVRNRSLRFCDKECAKARRVVDSVPDDQVEEESMEVHEGSCPVCHEPGPVDVHPWYTTYSLIVVTYFPRLESISCPPCGRKKQVLGILISLLFGWWAPWGILLTPYQIGKNLVAMRNPPDPRAPSEELKDAMRISLSGLE